MNTKTSQILVATTIEFMHLLDSGEASPAELRERAADLPAGARGTALALVDLAELLHQCKPATKPLPVTSNPRFRRGTAMKPVAWRDCLWQPQGVQ